MLYKQNNKKDQIVRKTETAAVNLRALSLCTNTLLQEILFLCVLAQKLVAADPDRRARPLRSPEMDEEIQTSV